MLKKKKETKLVTKVKKHLHDCGSISVQVVMLSYKIENLARHLEFFKKDLHSRLGLVKKINKRRNFLNYIKKRNKEEYEYIIRHLNIKIN